MNPKQRTEPKGPQRDLGGVCFTPNHAEHGSSPSPPDAGWLLLFVCPVPLKLPHDGPSGLERASIRIQALAPHPGHATDLISGVQTLMPLISFR